jgi:pyruvate dehydrogenase E1 component
MSSPTRRSSSAADSPETKYLLERRKALGGFVPARIVKPAVLDVPKLDHFAEFFGARPRRSSTTMAFGGWLSLMLLRTRASAKTSCPSFPTRRARSAWTRCFAKSGFIRPKASFTSRWTAKRCSYYHEAKDGQILEEGISEAGAMSSFIAAGTSYATHGVPMIPFYIYYSMFGPQRVGDLFWLAGDIRAKGFLLGATSGRTTLNGEGLQHQDGHSLLHASTIPTCLPYDPAFGYELAVIVADGCAGCMWRTRTFFITSRSTTKIMPCRRCRKASRTES